MKVLICRPLQKGGVTKFFQAVDKKMAVDIDYFTIGMRDDKINKEFTILRLFRDYYHFAKQLNKYDYDLIHLNPSLDIKAVLRDGIFVIISKLFHRRVIVFFHGWTKSFEQKLQKYLRPFYSAIYGMADAFIVLATDFKNSLKCMGVSKPIYTIVTVVEDQVIHSIDEDFIDVKNKKDIIDFNLLFLSRIQKDKGIYETIDAFNILKERENKIKLIVVGDGNDLPNVKEYTRSHNIEGVEFLGWLEGKSKIDVFQKSDIFVFPTTHGEGIPIAVLEAMAFGLPVITRPMGGIKDFFKDGDMGFLTESSEPIKIAELIEKFIKDKELRCTVSSYNYRFARENFTSEKVANKIEKIYHEVLTI